MNDPWKCSYCGNEHGENVECPFRTIANELTKIRKALQDMGEEDVE